MKTSLIIVLILMLTFGAQAGGMEDTDVSVLASGTSVTDTNEITALLTAHDWTAEEYILRFLPGGSTEDPTGGVPLFTSYEVRDGMLYLTSDALAGQAANVYLADGSLELVFDPQTSEYAIISLLPVVAQADAVTATPVPAPTPTAVATVPVFDVVTPTPMAVSFEDRIHPDHPCAGSLEAAGDGRNAVLPVPARRKTADHSGIGLYRGGWLSAKRRTRRRGIAGREYGVHRAAG